MSYILPILRKFQRSLVQRQNMNKIKSKCFSEGQVLINLPKLHTWKNISNHFLSNSLVQGNIVLGERKPCGGYRSWFLQYPIFQTSCKTVSELIQTYYFWALGLTSRKRALGGRIYYCPTTPTPPLRKDRIGMSAYVSWELSSWGSLQMTHYSLGTLTAPQLALPA